MLDLSPMMRQYYYEAPLSHRVSNVTFRMGPTCNDERTTTKIDVSTWFKPDHGCAVPYKATASYINFTIEPSGSILAVPGAEPDYLAITRAVCGHHAAH